MGGRRKLEIVVENELQERQCLCDISGSHSVLIKIQNFENQIIAIHCQHNWLG
jgi:hypothetical protein